MAPGGGEACISFGIGRAHDPPDKNNDPMTPTQRGGTPESMAVKHTAPRRTSVPTMYGTILMGMILTSQIPSHLPRAGGEWENH